MSGGQRQTLAIARAIYFGAKVLILDEPTSALGQKQQMEVLKTIKRVRARGDIAIIFITHNEIHSRLIADRYTFLALGEVIGSGTKAELEGEDIRRLMAGGRDQRPGTGIGSNLHTLRLKKPPMRRLFCRLSDADETVVTTVFTRATGILSHNRGAGTEPQAAEVATKRAPVLRGKPRFDGGQRLANLTIGWCRN